MRQQNFWRIVIIKYAQAFNFLFLLLILTFSLPVLAELKGIDCFGSSRITSKIIQNLYGSLIQELIFAYEKNDPRLFEIQQNLSQKIQSDFMFGFVDLSIIQYFNPNPGSYLTIDVVEPEELPKRMPFYSKPLGHFEDPEGLIAYWKEYSDLAFELQKTGQFQYPKTCPAFHCTHGFEDSKLAPFLPKISSQVPPNKSKLIEILLRDTRPEFRGNAIFLLAHTSNGHEISKLALSRLKDPSLLVRNNALRVLMAIADQHPEISIPLEPLIEALNYPETTDRNKAAFALVHLSKIKTNQETLIRKAAPILIQMLKLTQPNNHDPAYLVLKNLSQKDYGERNYSAWEKWLKKALSDKSTKPLSSGI